MRKGKLGLVLCLYPILAFACVIVSQPLLCALIFAFVLLAERDEWTGRQTLQALILSAVTALVRELLVYGASLFPPYSGFFQMVSVALGALSALVYLAAIILSILAILRVMKDQEAGLPLLSGLAYKAYGKRKPQRAPAARRSSTVTVLPCMSPSARNRVEGYFFPFFNFSVGGFGRGLFIPGISVCVLPLANAPLHLCKGH